MFKNEGIYITPEGYFLSQWQEKSQSYVGKKLSIDDIETHLNTNVFIDKNTRLHHVFTPILKSTIFPIIYKRDFWNEIIEEIHTISWKDWIGDLASIPDGEDIEYLEVYGFFEYNKEQHIIYNTPSLFNFHGIGFPFINEIKAKESFCKIGQRISYALFGNSITNYMNHPIKIGKFSFCGNINVPDSQETIINEADINISLGMLLHSILWDMSYFGVGAERDNLLNNDN